MRKMLGLIGIATLLLTGCGNSTDQEKIGETEPEARRAFGGLDIPSDQTTQLDTGTCVPDLPAAMLVTSNLEGAEVIIYDASEDIVAVTEFQTNHTDEFCSWYVDVDLEADSKFYKAKFLDMETPVVSLAESKPGEINLDFLTPIRDRAEEEHDTLRGTPLDIFPGT